MHTGCGYYLNFEHCERRRKTSMRFKQNHQLRVKFINIMTRNKELMTTLNWRYVVQFVVKRYFRVRLWHMKNLGFIVEKLSEQVFSRILKYLTIIHKMSIYVLWVWLLLWLTAALMNDRNGQLFAIAGNYDKLGMNKKSYNASILVQRDHSHYLLEN